jgi:hypothetical protein
MKVSDSDSILSESKAVLPEKTFGVPHHSISGAVLLSGHGIWSWDHTIAIWTLVEDKSEPGYSPGNGPSDPGRFHGQTIRWASIIIEEIGAIE